MQEVAIILSAVAIAIAGITAFMASSTAANSAKSLEIMHALQRPFLHIFLTLSYSAIRDRAIITVAIKNTGNLPADCIKACCSGYIIENEEIQEYALKLEKECSSIIFPSEKAQATYIVEGEKEVQRFFNQETNIKIIVNYSNRLSGQTHSSRRKYKIAIGSLSPSINAYQPMSIPDEDFWN